MFLDAPCRRVAGWHRCEVDGFGGFGWMCTFSGVLVEGCALSGITSELNFDGGMCRAFGLCFHS